MATDRRPNGEGGAFSLPMRLLVMGGVLGVALLVLWQAGVLFTPATSVDELESTGLAAADTSIETPNGGGLAVGLREGNLAPDFEFSAFDGKRMRLSDFRGRAVFLNFWATWCGPCRAELPDMQTIRERFEAQGLTVIGVNFAESFNRADRFIKELDVTLSVLAFDPAGAIGRAYEVRGMPTSYFIDASGRITRVVVGQLSPRVMEASVLDALAGFSARNPP